MLFTWKPFYVNKFLPCYEWQNIFKIYLQVPLKDKTWELNVIFIILLNIPFATNILIPLFRAPKKPRDHKVDLTSEGLGIGLLPLIKFYITAATF